MSFNLFLGASLPPLVTGFKEERFKIFSGDVFDEIPFVDSVIPALCVCGKVKEFRTFCQFTRPNQPAEKYENKKVLLRERKRHIDRGISSTPSAVLFQGGYPIPSWGGGTPLLAGGYPIMGTPFPILTWLGWYSIPGWGEGYGCTPLWKGHGTSWSIVGWRWVTPPSVDRLKT